MEERQKKILTFISQLILLGISISLIVVGLVFKDKWYIAILGTTLSPSTIIGIWIKLVINKKHKKEVKAIVEGEDMFKKPEPIKLYNGFEITFIKNVLTIKDTLNRTPLEILNFSGNALTEFNQDMLTKGI